MPLTTGVAHESLSTQIVLPVMFSAISSRVSRSSRRAVAALRCARGSSSSTPCPRGTACTARSSRARRSARARAICFTMILRVVEHDHAAGAEHRARWRRSPRSPSALASASSTVWIGTEMPPGMIALNLRPGQRPAAEVVQEILEREAHRRLRSCPGCAMLPHTEKSLVPVLFGLSGAHRLLVPRGAVVEDVRHRDRASRRC